MKSSTELRVCFMRLRHALLATVISLASAHAFANRDGAWQEQAKEDSLASCRADPVCWNAVQKKQQDKQLAQERWEAKPLDQKLEPYIIAGLAFWALWWWIGRKK